MAQLSLFLDHNGDSERVLGVRRKHRPSKRGSSPAAGAFGDQDHYESMPLPFDQLENSRSDLTALGEAQPVPPIVYVADVAQSAPASPDRADLLPEIIEEFDEAPVRITFDPREWQFRTDTGDFIHILTGEVREDDPFLVVEQEDAIQADFEEFPLWEEAVD